MPFMTTPERIGFENGLRQGRLENIEQVLKLKFGAEGLRLLPEIQQITDVEMLRVISQAIESATTPDDLRQVWSKPG